MNSHYSTKHVHSTERYTSGSVHWQFGGMSGILPMQLLATPGYKLIDLTLNFLREAGYSVRVVKVV